MRNLSKVILASLLTAAIALPALAAEKKKAPRQDDGVQEAIAYQRAKDRADAAQARKQARHPEHFTYAAPQPPSRLAEQQRQETAKRDRR